MFSTARRYSSNASRWADSRAASGRTGQRRLERLLAESGPLEVERRVDLRLRPRAPAPNSPARAWIAAAVAHRRAPIERVAQQLVAEVVVAVVDRPEVEQDAVVDQLLERLVELPGREVHDPGEHLRHEAAPDDRAGPGDRLRLRRPPADARQDGVLDGVRARWPHGSPGRRPGPRAHGARAAPRCGAGCRRCARRPPRRPRAAPADRYRGAAS